MTGKLFPGLIKARFYKERNILIIKFMETPYKDWLAAQWDDNCFFKNNIHKPVREKACKKG
jgi:hypothetical protein